MSSSLPPSVPHRPTPGQKLGRVAIVVDERLSRERSPILTRVINAIRQFADVELLSGAIDEDRLIHKLEAEPYKLVLAPWYRYLAWPKAEAFYGLTRTSGPTFAGYFCEPLQPYELGEQAGHLRAILLDFGSPSTQETITIVRALLQETKRSGILPLLRHGSPVYCEHWYAGQGVGPRVDAVLSLPEIAESDWRKRAGALRIAICSLWSLLYEEGPAKAADTTKTPKGAFQIGIDAHHIVLRLSYVMPSWSPKDALQAFWPNPKLPTAPAQLLLQFADFVRVHTIAEGALLEIVAAFQASAPGENHPGRVRTLWVEPLAPNLMVEPPFDLPSPNAPHLKLLPTVSHAAPKPRAAEPDPADSAKERFVADAMANIRQLKTQLAQREKFIQELRSGGVGTAPPLPPPDGEALLEAFQERYFEARFQIRQFEVQLAELATKGATPQEVEGVRRKMQLLADQEQVWIRKLAKTIELFREARKKAPSS